MTGVPLGEQDVYMEVGKKVKSLVFVHTCLGSREHIVSYRRGIVDWHPAVYSVHYSDGTSVIVGARYGIDIGSVNMDLSRRVLTESLPAYDENPEIGKPASTPIDDPTWCMMNHPWRGSLLYSASPFPFGGDSWAYSMEWVNPRPDDVIERVYAVNNVRKKDEQVLLYCAAAIV
jgi:hypothetical protein